MASVTGCGTAPNRPSFGRVKCIPSSRSFFRLSGRATPTFTFPLPALVAKCECVKRKLPGGVTSRSLGENAVAVPLLRKGSSVRALRSRRAPTRARNDNTSAEKAPGRFSPSFFHVKKSALQKNKTNTRSDQNEPETPPTKLESHRITMTTCRLPPFSIQNPRKRQKMFGTGYPLPPKQFFMTFASVFSLVTALNRTLHTSLIPHHLRDGGDAQSGCAVQSRRGNALFRGGNLDRWKAKLSFCRYMRRGSSEALERRSPPAADAREDAC